MDVLRGARLAIVGAGKMGEALLSGLLRTNVVSPQQIVCTDASRQRREEVAAKHGVAVGSDNAAAVRGAGVVLLAVKPQIMSQVLDGISGAVDSGQVVISIAAGVSTETIERKLPPGIPVVRVMPNVGAVVGSAISVIAAGKAATDDDIAVAEHLMRVVGEVSRMSEEHMDAVTAISGSGPAYFFLVVEAMVEAGQAIGLTGDQATTLAVQTLVGAAHLLRDSEQDAATLRAMVTSPGGTTAAAIEQLEAAGLRDAFLKAIVAAKKRGEELGAQ